MKDPDQKKSFQIHNTDWKPKKYWSQKSCYTVPGSRSVGKTNLSSPSTFLIFLASSLSRSFSLVSAFSSSALYVSFTLPASREAERYGNTTK